MAAAKASEIAGSGGVSGEKRKRRNRKRGRINVSKKNIKSAASAWRQNKSRRISGVGSVRHQISNGNRRQTAALIEKRNAGGKNGMVAGGIGMAAKWR